MREANTKRGESESERGYKVSPLCFWETCSSVKQKCSDEEERQKKLCDAREVVLKKSNNSTMLFCLDKTQI